MEKRQSAFVKTSLATNSMERFKVLKQKANEFKKKSELQTTLENNK